MRSTTSSRAAPAPNRRRPAKPDGRSAGPSRLLGTARRVIARTVFIVTRVLIAGGIVTALAALGFFVHHYVTNSEHFEIREIVIRGMSRVGRDEILEAGGIAAGANIFRLDVDGAERKIGQIAWIREARVVRRLPGTVRVRVRERTPSALIELEGLYLVDAEGEIFKKLGERDPADLPVITGLARQTVIDHPRASGDAIREALGLVAEYDDGGLANRAPLSEIHRDGASGFSLVLADGATRVRLGPGPYRVKLARLSRLLQELGRRGLGAQYIYLDNRVRQDRATVKLRPAPKEESPG
ncbi:MAG: FtsQ-type POTRA domain-containing protein [Deltaproteobacteria bacterium]|nr:FtsQ-type POTRA domain-containing protein [Deltaproteobacteria bacterium]